MPRNRSHGAFASTSRQLPSASASMPNGPLIRSDAPCAATGRSARSSTSASRRSAASRRSSSGDSTWIRSTAAPGSTAAPSSASVLPGPPRATRAPGSTSRTWASSPPEDTSIPSTYGASVVRIRASGLALAA